MRVRLLPAAVLVLVAGCSAGSPPASAPAPSATPAPAASPAAPAETDGPRLIEVTYSGGEVRTAQPRVDVGLGEPVVLRVTSDVPEQVHVHGYDLTLDLVPGVPAELVFPADKPGGYEVELHEAGRPLLQLRVA